MTTPQPELPAPMKADRVVQLDDIVPGRLIRRFADQTRAGLFAPLPCHGEHRRQACKLDPRASAVTVVCRTCSRTYDAQLWPDSEGGYWTEFQLSAVQSFLSSARRT
jgi:hypothetical protein